MIFTYLLVLFSRPSTNVSVSWYCMCTQHSEDASKLAYHTEMGTRLESHFHDRVWRLLTDETSSMSISRICLSLLAISSCKPHKPLFIDEH